MINRIKITIEGPQGAGKTQIRKAIETTLQEMQRTYKTYDPVYKFKPEEIDFEDAQVIIMVKQKNSLRVPVDVSQGNPGE